MSDGQRKRYGTDVGPWDLDVGPWDLDVGRLDLRDEGSKLHVCHADMHFDVGAVVVQLLQRPCRLVRTIHEERACPTRTVTIVTGYYRLSLIGLGYIRDWIVDRSTICCYSNYCGIYTGLA